VTEQLLHRLKRSAAHDQMTGEAVPKNMPANPPFQPCPIASSPKRPLALLSGEHAAVGPVERGEMLLSYSWLAPD